jgi:hypothetical protein
MTTARYARLLAGILARRRPREEVPAPLTKRMEEIALIQRTMERKKARRRARVLAGVGGSLVLALAGAFVPRVVQHRADAPALRVLASSMGGGTITTPSGSPVTLGADVPLASGSRLQVGPAAGASLALSTGTRISIDPGSDVAYHDRGRAAVFGLHSGSMHADVAKLTGEDRFIVETDDSEVEVRGTSFRVSVVQPDAACGDGTSTRVTVYEGVVAVRTSGHEHLVAKGETWPAGCVPIAAPADRARESAAPDARAEAARPSARAASPHADVSSLAEQNDLFAEAMLAKRSGAAGAIAAFDRFLAKYPTSHLAENAAAERMKLLLNVDRAKATQAARHYLTKYPAGFARDDAKVILQSSP